MYSEQEVRVKSQKCISLLLILLIVTRLSQ